MRLLLPAFLLGLVSAVLMALWLFLHRESWGERAALLLAVWFAGGFLGASAASLSLALLARLGFARLSRWLRPLAFLPAFLLAGSLAFLVQNRIQAGGYDLHPERPFLSFFFSSAQIIAVFLYSVPHYLLPWMGPAMILAGYALLPSAQTPSKVEPRARAV